MIKVWLCVQLNVLRLEIEMNYLLFKTTEVVSNRLDTISAGRQAIVPSYKLICEQMCGNITEWGVDVDRENQRGYNFS